MPAKSLFEFGASVARSPCCSEERAARESLAERIFATYKNQDRLVAQIVGHADPFACPGEATNTKLSLGCGQATGEFFVAN